MWDFLSKNCGIFSIEGGTKLWDFQHRGGDFRPLTSGHTEFYQTFESSIFRQKISSLFFHHIPNSEEEFLKISTQCVV